MKMLYLLKLAAVSILPGALWVVYFRSKDVYDPEPSGLLVRTFIVGALATIPAGLIEAPFRGLITNPPSLAVMLVASIFGIGLVEEYLKYWAVRWAVYNHDEFNEPVDGVIYAVTAGLGFAALENVLYAVSYGLTVGLTRGVITSIVHASFSGIVGYALGMAKFVPKGVKPVVVGRAVLTAAVLHGVYDFLLFTELMSFPVLAGVVILLYLGILGRIGSALKLSPFAHRGSPWPGRVGVDTGADTGVGGRAVARADADSGGGTAARNAAADGSTEHSGELSSRSSQGPNPGSDQGSDRDSDRGSDEHDESH
jgi:RsiW-degrading membrane proteinase PrsW (M82 family)